MKYFLFVLCSLGLNAQNLKKFDSIYNEVENKYFELTLTLDEINDAISNCPNISEYPDLLFYRGYIHTDKKNYPEALQDFFTAKKYANSYELEYDILNNIGVVYTSSNKYIDAKNIYQQTLDLAKANNNKIDIENSIENLLIVEIQIKGKEAIEDYKRFVLEKISKRDYCSFLQSINILGESYIQYNEYDKMKKISDSLNNYIKNYEDCKVEYFEWNILNSKIATHEKKPTKSLFYLSKVKIENTFLDDLKIQAYKLFKKNYKELGNDNLSEKYNDSIIMLLEQGANEKNQSGITTVTNSEKKQEKINFRLLLSKYLIIICLVIITVVLILLIISKKIRTTLNEKITYQKEKYNSLWADYQISTRQLQNLKQELTKQVKFKGDSEVKSLVKNITLHLNSNMNDGDKHINLIKNKFVNNLHKKAPYLNDKEKLICFFLNLDLTHKKIAELLNKTEKSIDSYKYRINKKVLQNNKTSLDELIRSLKIN